MKVHQLAGPVSTWRLELETRLLHRLVHHRWFALTDLLLVIVSGVVWILIPKFGIWFTLIALLPWGLRLLGKGSPFQRTPFDWLIAIFLITTWVGYWASYDKAAAWTKAWLIVTAILLYFALSTQPKHNLALLSLLSLGFAVCLSIHFFITYELTDSPSGLALWWNTYKPKVNWLSIPQGYTSGLIAITGSYALYGIWHIAKNKKTKSISSFTIKLLLTLGIGIPLSALILTMSRGILVAGVAILGVGFLWKVLNWSRQVTESRAQIVFPVLILLYLSALIIFVYLILANLPDGANQTNYGNNSREEVFGRGSYFLVDYPIIGAGLSSFPGLYSQYMIVIPFYYFTNTYNLFLDIAIEQGLIGGLAFMFLCVGTIWLVSQTIIKTSSEHSRFFSWVSLFALLITVVHGFFYDYLYNDKGTLLLFFPIGISMIGVLDSNGSQANRPQLPRAMLVRDKINIRIVLVLVIGLITILALNSNKLIAIWYANLGAVKMSQIELGNFPTNRWIGTELAFDLTGAEAVLLRALHYDPNNQTANHRLGLISILHQDFDAASVYLEKAYIEAPEHRGIIKTLGYCYVWLGKTEKASLLLAQIPESKNELKTYIWWWETQQRADLAEKAAIMVSRLE